MTGCMQTQRHTGIVRREVRITKRRRYRKEVFVVHLRFLSLSSLPPSLPLLSYLFHHS
jgi:hypothetical protein